MCLRALVDLHLSGVDLRHPGCHLFLGDLAVHLTGEV
jgi:hypothetical protein